MPFLQVINIEKHYGFTQALQGVSFTLEKAQIVSLLGVNGAGKTTISSIIATLQPPTKGTLYFQGQEVYTDMAGYRSKIGYCPQKPNLHPLLTIQDNLLLAAQAYGLSTKDAHERVTYLAKWLTFEQYLHHKPSQPSGGYRQRILIARALVHKPSLIILDEPTVGLDPHVRREIWEILKQVRTQGTTILLTTHYLDEAELLSDNIIFMSEGKVQLINTPQNLLKEFGKKNLEDVFIELASAKSE